MLSKVYEIDLHTCRICKRLSWSGVSQRAIEFLKLELGVQNLNQHVELFPTKYSKEACNQDDRRYWMGATNHLLSDNLAKVLHSQEGLENLVTLNIDRDKSIRLHYLNDTIDEDHFCTDIDENNNILIKGCL